MATALQRYYDKRDFSITSEPTGGTPSAGGTLSYVIQKHAATRLHYDFRLELDGTLKSWAVPKGPSFDPADKRMAVHVEDHPLGYATFEGTIPPKQYGAGQVIVWDRGTWEPIGDPRAGYAAGKLKFRLYGEKLHGGWTLVRMHRRAGERQEPWLLIKERDDAARPASEFNVVEELPASVLSGATIEDQRAGSGKSAKPLATATPAEAAAAADAAPEPAAKKPTRSATKGSAASASKTAAPAKKTAWRAAAKGTKASAAAKAPTKRAKPTEPEPLAQPAEPAASPPEAGDDTLALPAGAQPAAVPATLAPQLATLVASAPHDAGWVYEIKFDGYRLLARIDGGDVRLFTRNGNDWTDKLVSLARDLKQLALPAGWYDGEIVVVGSGGAPDFNALQNAFEASKTEAIQYYLFDLPFCAGHDLRSVPLVERRALLDTVLGRATADHPASRIRYSQDFPSTPEELLQNACRMRLEGVIGKRADSPYVGKRSPNWIKLKCTQRQEFVIGGWTDPQGSRTGIGSLLLGIHDEAGNLRFAGGVGTGFDEATLRMLRKRLDAIGAAKTPFVEKPRDVRGHWVEPTLVAEVSFGEWTRDGRVRHAVFHGLRSDKPAESITREEAKPGAVVEAAADAEVAQAAPAPRSEGKATQGKEAPAASAHAAAKSTGKAASKTAAKTSATTPAKKRAAADDAPTAESLGVRVSNPDRVIDPSTGATKVDVVNHYLHVARLMLPHLAGRPVSMVRAPTGITGPHVFQRHAETLKIAELKKLDPSILPGKPPMVEIDSFTALISAAQANVIEFHTWNSPSKAADKPDRMIFDIDPGEGVGWKQIQEAADITGKLLDELGLASFLKTSGGKGLHVVVPLTPKDRWERVKDVSEAIVAHLSRVFPDRFVLKSGPKNRIGRIFVDYLRNGFGATTAAAYSVRARPGLGVSVPCSWDELGSLTSGAHWTVATMPERLDEPGDPWRAYWTTRQTLAKAAKALGVG
ncbi:DNA ligase D [Piscinibacter koreensis]|uniref:DNA ligase (ATP) n=1 Tax=Piscinibacter koreensis TaxID=2742824 RepID=A0A7Y6TW30_9BURK|nr:DNA ligase D [Schlegelella koreensis]NUZ05571.1 DNA ligase D [Schlegelella koreensis]